MRRAVKDGHQLKQNKFNSVKLAKPEKLQKTKQRTGKANKGCVMHCGLTIYIKKSILRQKKNYENSKYFTMQKI
jgi:hypothetical protein